MTHPHSRRGRLLASTVAIVLAATGTVLIGQPAQAAGPSTSTVLPITSYYGMAYDTSTSKLFISGGSEILVASRAGAITATIALTGVEGIAVSPSTQRLYAAVPTKNEVAVINTSTNKVLGYLATGVDPETVALAGGKVWIAVYDPSSTHGEIDVYDPAHPAGGVKQVTLPTLPDGDLGQDPPELWSGGETTTTLVATPSLDVENSEAEDFTVSGTTLTLVDQQEADAMSAVAVTSNGSAYTTSTAGYEVAQRYKTADGSDYGTYAGMQDDCESGGAYTADGNWYVCAGGTDLNAYHGDSSHLVWDDPLNGYLFRNGLAMTPDGITVFTVVANYNVGQNELDVYAGPEATNHPPTLPRPGLGLDWTQKPDGTIAYDPAHQHVFVSPGPLGSEIAVTDLTGKLVTRIPHMWGAKGMVLSPDGTKLFVALSTGDAVAVVNTSTLATTTLPTGALSGPTGVAIAGNRLWVNVVRFSGVVSDFASIDPGTLTGGWVDSHAATFGQLLAAGSAASTHLVAGTDNGTPNLVAVSISGTTATETSPVSENWPDITQLSVTSSGKDVWAYGQDPNYGPAEVELSTTDLHQVAVLDGVEGSPTVSTDGLTLLTGSRYYNTTPGLALYNVKTGALIKQDPIGDVAWSTLSSDGKYAFAVVSDTSGSTPVLTLVVAGGPTSTKPLTAAP